MDEAEASKTTATAGAPPTVLAGIDFTSRPSAAKPIVVALGARHGDVVRLERFVACTDWPSFEQWLASPTEGRPCLAGFDLPFGLPRALLEALDWPRGDWRASIAHVAVLERASIRAAFKAYCDARPAGAKFAHRATDRPAGSSPSMKWVNPPVAWMLHAGVPRLLAAGWHAPAHAHVGDGDAARTTPAPARIALEAYPGLVARVLLGPRASYKADDAARRTSARRDARQRLLDALAERGWLAPAGAHLQPLRLSAAPSLAAEMVEDARGDRLDAALCLLQAGWAERHGAPRWGLPTSVDPLEGWIVGC
jgi:hypothetical protein